MKATIKFSVTVLYSVLMMICSYGQSGKISGTIVDEFGPLAGASVRLMDATMSNAIRGVVSDFDGNFNIQAELEEDMYLEFRYMGYETLFSNKIRLSNNRKEVILDSIHMAAVSEGLEAVSLTVKKKEISLGEGKMKIKVEDNPMAQGESAYGLLNRLPGVSLTHNGDILLNGKSGVKITVNDRMVYMSGEELKTYLESLPSDAISNIEINTRPSAAMDAEGGAGILNINLKKGRSKNLAGNITAGYAFQNRNLWNGNIFLNKQHNKFDWAVILDASEKSNTRNQALSTTYNQASELEWLKQKGKEKNVRRPLFLQFDTNLNVTDNQKTGINFQLGKKTSHKDWDTETDIKERSTGKIRHIRSFNDGDEDFEYGVLSAYYEIQTDTLGSSFRISADGSKVNRELDTHFLNEFDVNLPETFSERSKSPARNDYQIFAGKADYHKSFKNGMVFKAGSKYSRVNFDSQLEFYAIQDNTPIYVENRSNTFDYEENIFALYSEFETKLGTKLNLHTGLRMEKTWGEGVERIAGTNHKKNYMDWFPSVSLTRQVNDNYSVEFAYFKRIIRPQYEFLNPQIFYIDPYNYIKGNPSLKPEKRHIVEINNIIKKKYQVGISFTYHEDFIGEVPKAEIETNQTVFSMMNLSKALDFGITAFVPVEVTKFWSMNNTMAANYQSYSLDWDNRSQRKQGSAFVLVQNQHQLKLPKEFLFGVNVMARSGLTYGYYRVGGNWGTDMFLQKSLNNNTWNFNLKVTDVFRSLKMNIDYEFNGNSNNIKQYMGDRNISFQIKYRFGNGKKNTIENAKDFEEFERINK